MNWLSLLWQSFWAIVEEALQGDHAANAEPSTAPQEPPAVESPSSAPTPVIEAPSAKYDWSTPEAARHSCRLIADEEGLSVGQKNVMSQVIHCESGYKTKVIHENKNQHNVVTSTDYGIAQWNDYFHGKEISPEEALNNPEMAVRLMCHYVKAGRISQWSCYQLGLYHNYSA